MCEISRETFRSFYYPQWKQVKLKLRSHEGLIQVKVSLIDFLADWNDKEWIDWEKIELVLRDLNRAGLWRILPYQKFLAEAETEIASEIVHTLKKLPY